MEILINIDVPELDPAIAFYSTGLGFTYRRQLGTGVAEMQAGNTRLYLLKKPEGSPPIPQNVARRDYNRHWTPVHIDIAVADINVAVRRAHEAGAIIESPIAAHAWGSIAVLSDPFGNGFCLIQFSEQGYDAIAG